MIGQAERLYQINSLMESEDFQNKSNIIAITSGKGGTGKSFIASNLALLLADQKHKVLLVDLDINLANQNVIFNYSSKQSMYHYLIHNKQLPDVISKYSDNLHIIFGESGKIDHPKLSASNVSSLFSDLKKLSSEYDYIILDTSSGIEQGTLEIILNSDEVILVSSTEPTSVMDGYVVLKMLKSYGANIKTNILINKSFDENDAYEAFENLNKAVKHFLNKEITFMGQISFSEEVVKSLVNQNPLILSLPNSPIACQFEQILTKLKIQTIG